MSSSKLLEGHPYFSQMTVLRIDDDENLLVTSE